MDTRRKRLTILGAAAAAIIVAAVLAFGYFEVQTAFIDDSVDEAAPVTVDVTRRGEFLGLEHETSGIATVADASDGRILRLESLSTSNGPDLHVYLAEDADLSEGDPFVDLGPLKGNVGNQNYAIPDATDLGRFSVVLIQCVRFDASFGAAVLEDT